MTGLGNSSTHLGPRGSSRPSNHLDAMLSIRRFALSAILGTCALLSPGSRAWADDDSGALLIFATADQIEQHLLILFGDSAKWLLQTIGDTAIWRILAAFLTFALLLGIRRLVLRLGFHALRLLVERTETDLDDRLVDAAERPARWLTFLLAFYVGTRWLVLADGAEGALLVLLRIGVIVCVFSALYRASDVVGLLLGRVAEERELPQIKNLTPLIQRFLHVSVLLVASVFVIQELGFNVGALLAGLGVGGLAVALAAKDTLSNWFGALMIYTDRPFGIGDWIRTNQLEGTVEEIGLRSTKVRTFAKTVVSVPNANLAGDVVENFSRMPLRRVMFTLGVTYGTSPNMMRESLERIRHLLATHDEVDQGFWVVRFTEFGASSLDIFVMYFTKTVAWDAHLAVREDINLRIITKLAEIGVSVAFPSRSVYLEQNDREHAKRMDEQAAAFLEERRQGVAAR